MPTSPPGRTCSTASASCSSSGTCSPASTSSTTAIEPSGDFVTFVNRAKDELVTPDDFDAFVAAERDEYERRYGSYAAAAERLVRDGHLEAVRDVRSRYAAVRAKERAEAAGLEAGKYRPDEHDRRAEREARRAVIGTGRLVDRKHLDEDQLDRIDRLADHLRPRRRRPGGPPPGRARPRLPRLPGGARAAGRPGLRRADRPRHHAVQVEAQRPPSLAAPVPVHPRRRVPGRQRRPDRAHRAPRPHPGPPRQRDGGRGRRPVDLPLPGRQLRRVRGVRRPLRSRARARSGRRPGRAAPPPPDRPELPLRRPRPDRRQPPDPAATRPVSRPTSGCGRNARTGEAIELLVCAGPEDEAVAIVDRIKALAGPGGRQGADPRAGPRQPWTDVAVLYRKHKHRDAIVARLRAEDIPYTVVGGLSLFEAPEIRDLEQGLRAVANPHDDAALVRMMTAGPWRMDAIEILGVTRARAYDRSEHILETASALRDNDDTPPETRAKLRALLATIDELNPLHLPGRSVHHPRALPRAHRPGPRPARGGDPGGQALGHQHRGVHAVRRRLAGRQPGAGASGTSPATSTRTRRPAASCPRAWSCPRTWTASGS